MSSRLAASFAVAIGCIVYGIHESTPPYLAAQNVDWNTTVDSEQLMDLEPQQPEILWVTPAEAKESTKPDWFHVTRTKGCAACVVADRMLSNFVSAGASEVFDCVKVVDPAGDHKWMAYWKIKGTPTDLFVRADGQAFVKYVGPPVDENGHGFPAAYALRFRDAVKSLEATE